MSVILKSGGADWVVSELVEIYEKIKYNINNRTIPLIKLRSSI